MLLFCPACQSAFTGVTRCPRCGGLLLLPEEAPPSPGEPGRAPAPPLRPTPSARVVVGVVTALGLYLGLRKIGTGVLLASSTSPDLWWQSSEGLLSVFGLQSIAIAFGAILASAGRHRGSSLGSLVGGMCGVMFVVAEIMNGTPGYQLVLAVQPLILTVVGAIAGAVGAWVWAGVPELEMPLPTPKKLSSIELAVDRPEDSGRPTSWLHVAAGVVVIVAGFGLAEKVRGGAEKASGGLLRVETRGQAKFLSWQIATLAIIAGGVWAGAGTGAGLRHGTYAGFLGGIAVAGLTGARGELSHSAEYFLTLMGLALTNPPEPASLVGLASGVFVAGMIGGWLGGQLFLPLAPPHMRKRKLRFGGD